MLCELKGEIGSDASSVRTLCPTRWTVHAESLASILSNYGNIQLLWETVVHATSDTEIKVRIQGVASQCTLSSSSLVIYIILCEMILWYTDKLSQTLQQPTLSGVEGHEVALVTVKALQHLWTDDNLDLFWQKVEKMSYQFDIAEPQLARK